MKVLNFVVVVEKASPNGEPRRVVPVVISTSLELCAWSDHLLGEGVYNMLSLCVMVSPTSGRSS